MSAGAETQAMATAVREAARRRNRRVAALLVGFAAALFLGSILFVALGR